MRAFTRRERRPIHPQHPTRGARGGRPAAAALVAVLLMGARCDPASSPPPAPISTATLAGDWFEVAIYDGQDVLLGAAPGWTLGRLSLDASGQRAYVDWIDALGGSPPGDAAWTADAAGALSATDPRFTSFHGRLASSRDTAVAVARENASCSLRILRRIAPGASPSVPGTAWRYHALVTGGATGWERGVATVGDDGVLALTQRVTGAGGIPDEPRAATLSSADPSGELAGVDDTGADVLAGWIASDGSLLVLAGVVDPATHAYWTAIAMPEGGGFAQAYVSGAHTVLAEDVSTSTVGGAPTAGFGCGWASNEVDAAGHATFGTWTDVTSGTTHAVGPVTVRLAPDGEATLAENPTWDGALAGDASLLVATATITGAGLTSSRLVLWVR